MRPTLRQDVYQRRRNQYIHRVLTAVDPVTVGRAEIWRHTVRDKLQKRFTKQAKATQAMVDARAFATNFAASVLQYEQSTVTTERPKYASIQDIVRNEASETMELAITNTIHNIVDGETVFGYGVSNAQELERFIVNVEAAEGVYNKTIGENNEFEEADTHAKLRARAREIAWEHEDINANHPISAGQPLETIFFVEEYLNVASEVDDDIAVQSLVEKAKQRAARYEVDPLPEDIDVRIEQTESADTYLSSPYQ